MRVMRVKVNGFVMQHLCLLSCLFWPVVNKERETLAEAEAFIGFESLSLYVKLCFADAKQEAELSIKCKMCSHLQSSHSAK